MVTTAEVPELFQPPPANGGHIGPPRPNIAPKHFVNRSPRSNRSIGHSSKADKSAQEIPDLSWKQHSSKPPVESLGTLAPSGVGARTTFYRWENNGGRLPIRRTYKRRVSTLQRTKNIFTTNDKGKTEKSSPCIRTVQTGYGMLGAENCSSPHRH